MIDLDPAPIPPAWQRRLDQVQNTLREQLRWRLCDTYPGAQQPRYKHGGQWRINFASNDYLGLANHPILKRALAEGVERFGVGAGAAHLLGGHRSAHQALEQRIAQWTKRPAALLFSTGYMANLAIATAFTQKGDCLVQDKLNHASMIDGARLSQATLKRYPHADAEAARRQIDSHSEGLTLLMSDGVFSMDGDIAPLPELARHCRETQALLMVDDAHGLGVLGANGGGCIDHFRLSTRDVPILMGTLGKALGGFGAFVAGEEAIIEQLRQFGRSYLFTTATPPAVAHALISAIDLVQNEPQRRAQLHQVIEYFQTRAEAMGIPVTHSHTPIQPIVLGDESRTLQIAQALQKTGFDIGAIRPPTVPQGQCRLRITLRADHRQDDIEALLDALAGALDF
ncbi:8-amino-7-oxononanoate synthase [gamma proteobacterium HTCC5015]|nr:8-amino-7-oxononanoate synthase [gamma proteobacterium HTCC5015]